MKYVPSVFTFTVAIAIASNCLAQKSDQSDWRVWRGPTSNGITADGEQPPIKWDEETNIIWKTKVPGKGHASPIVVDDRIFLATADKESETQSVLCFDRATGKELWNKVVYQGNFNPRIYPTNSHASSTIASDGQHIFAVFNNDESARLAKLDLDGNVVWDKKAGTFKPTRYKFGFGASPIIYGDFVIVSSESETDPFVSAFSTDTGEQIWRIKRPTATSYSTPTVATVAGKEQLLISGGGMVAGYDPKTGEELWSVDASWSVTCGTMVVDGDMVFASGGYPRGQTVAINARTGELVWENRRKCYEQSMLARDGYVYALTDKGLVYCWNAKDGAEAWSREEMKNKGRLENPVSASPVYANGHVYFTSQRGNTFVVEATPEKFNVVEVNKLGSDNYASMAICGNRIYTRVAVRDGRDRQEWLYCIGEK